MVEVVIQVDRGRRWLRLREPVRVIDVRIAADVGAALDDVERFTHEQGGHAAGFVTYEAGRAFGMRTCTPDPDLPLAWFALFDGRNVTEIAAPAAASAYEVHSLAPSIDQSAFDHAFAKIRHHIGNGDTYQVNYTFDLKGHLRGDAFSLFADLAGTQRGRYSAFVNTGSHAICSASPELFFARADGGLETRPMKGTARRGRTPTEDNEAAAALRTSSKERAENVMIVDLMRNDLSRVCEPGSVGVDGLLEVESYAAVHQLVSTVSGRLMPGTTVGGLLDAAFPAGSMTGAPKLSAMTILHRLEGAPRGIFSGCFGWVGDDGALDLAMIIRSIVTHPGGAYVGAGGGITWRSDAAAEVAEVGIKARGPLAAMGAALPPGW
jgi:anthranilate synthase component 1